MSWGKLSVEFTGRVARLWYSEAKSTPVALVTCMTSRYRGADRDEETTFYTVKAFGEQAKALAKAQKGDVLTGYGFPEPEIDTYGDEDKAVLTIAVRDWAYAYRAPREDGEEERPRRGAREDEGRNGGGRRSERKEERREERRSTRTRSQEDEEAERPRRRGRDEDEPAEEPSRSRRRAAEDDEEEEAREPATSGRRKRVAESPFE